MPTHESSRRQFLAFLAGSPLLAAAGFDASVLTRLLRTPAQQGLIQAAHDALDVFDFAPVAKQKIPTLALARAG